MGILENLRETFKHVKGGSSRGIQICPKCGSREIHTKLTGGGGGWIFPASYECDACGYEGSIVLELEEEEEDSVST